MKAPRQFNNITERLVDDLKASLTPKSSLYDKPLLTIDGQNMDSVYNGLLTHVSGLHATAKEEYKEQSELRKQVCMLKKLVKALQKQVLAEKQFNRQIEPKTEARRLKAMHSEPKDQLETFAQGKSKTGL